MLVPAAGSLGGAPIHARRARGWRLVCLPSAKNQMMTQRSGTPSPEARSDGDGRDMAVPALTLALRLAEDVAHDLAPGTLRRDAVFGPFRQVLQVERQVILRSTRPGRPLGAAIISEREACRCYEEEWTL